MEVEMKDEPSSTLPYICTVEVRHRVRGLQFPQLFRLGHTICVEQVRVPTCAL